ncbi:MAG: transposase [Nitrospira sp.]|nr:transposase [Nitrospira sp.]
MSTGDGASDGTIQKWIKRAVEALRPAYEAIRQEVIAADVAWKP